MRVDMKRLIMSKEIDPRSSLEKALRTFNGQAQGVTYSIADT
jgi:hypothetical protein